MEPLRNRLIALPESRELDLFAGLLERRGARVLRAPLVAIRDAPDPNPVLEWLREFSTGRCEFLVLLTGEGLRRLMACIERHDPALRAPFIAALATTQKITRGPKPVRALRELGLIADVAASEPTTAGIIAALGTMALESRTVGVQLYGTDPNQPLQDFLRQAGAKILAVAPYVYANAVDDQAVCRLLATLRSGTVDAIAFTSKAQVERLFAVAPAQDVLAALATTQIAAVGPIVAAALTTRGALVAAQPDKSWFMKPLTAVLAELLRSEPSSEEAIKKP